ncbi:heavy metal translocating P-type ATPase [Methylobrevis pamukkalensis]|uniref:Copper-exporting P-type ATPase A n=1 Tax=Methylobrevis pamukkalensis TaxID=1439726 RepID=A0A1E3H7R7_9HYPH|nr:heavy metal translocating P-type ATPase [Methylobrevis pamukkalensis]ODN72360.1 Copper-exporting P-type ATPase A [Methylobrevis pamukkalensis]
MTTVLDLAAPMRSTPAAAGTVARDWTAFAATDASGVCRMEFALEGITCAACMTEIEQALRPLAGVETARVNLSNRRLALAWRPDAISPDTVLARLAALGYPARPFDPALATGGSSAEQRRLLRAIGVAGFAVMNVMLLSISIWSGNVTDITPETRDFFHWVSALIAMPAVAYAGQPFFSSALSALRHGRVNMDVPISLGVLLAVGLSFVSTLTHGTEAYFDSALMLLFFLLTGRFLDENMRRRTAVEAETLAALRADTAIRLGADGSLADVPVSAIRPGERVLVRPGERVPVDGIVLTGASEIDVALVTGETLPEAVAPGAAVHAGTLNISGVLVVRVSAGAADTRLAEIERLLANAAAAKSATMRLADRVARAYAPVVHAVALSTFVGWTLAGTSWTEALVIAIAVLIITCPCALALAVPAVQVVTAGLLFRAGVLLNAGDAIERLAAVDTVVFDKTGTLTLPDADLAGALDPDAVLRAGDLAGASRHPLAAALYRASGIGAPLEDLREVPGCGVETSAGPGRRLGSPAFCGVAEADLAAFRDAHPGASVIAYAEEGRAPVLFAFAQRLRPGAAAVIAALRAEGIAVEILSGDTVAAVARTAADLGLDTFTGAADPAAKIARLAALKAQGRRVLMVGDGLNDAPALAAAHVSMAPASGASLAKVSADAVFLGEGLGAVPESLRLSRAALRAMRQNLAIALVYNLVAVPVAIAGHVTPLIAALAMSGSSLIVTVNALRLRLARRRGAVQGQHSPAGATPPGATEAAA